MPEKDPYQCLGISPDASPDEIERQYARRRADLLGRIQRQASTTTMGYRKAVSEIELQELDDAHAALQRTTRKSKQSSRRKQPQRATAAPQAHRPARGKPALLILSLLLLLGCCVIVFQFNQETLRRRKEQRVTITALQQNLERLQVELRRMQSGRGDAGLGVARKVLQAEVARQRESFTQIKKQRQAEITTNAHSLNERVATLADTVSALEAAAQSTANPNR